MSNKFRLLLIDDDQEWGHTFISELSPLDFDIHFETEAESALKRINLDKPDIILLDILWTTEDGSHVNKGKQTLKKIKNTYPDMPVIMLTNTMGSDFSETDYPGAVFPYGKDSFETGDKEAYARFAELIIGEIKKKACKVSADERYGFIVGKTPLLKEICKKIDVASTTKEPVLITGETGTGKELTAMAIHNHSGRRGTFITVNCGAFSETILESELFGHERGAFTGADKKRNGVFEAASEGTVFLDEIGDAPLKVQVELLRVIQSGEIKKLGSPMPISVNTRIIAATNKNLNEEIKNKRFRQDLLYRLKVIEIYMPPLRNRKEDILELAEHFIKKFNDEHKGSYKTPSLRKDVVALLQGYNWPGNIRELGKVIYSAALHTKSNWLLPSEFSLETNQMINSFAIDTVSIVSKFKNKEIDFNSITKRVAVGTLEMKAILEGICLWCYENEGRLTEELLVKYLGLNTRANVQRILSANSISTIKLKQQFPRR